MKTIRFSRLARFTIMAFPLLLNAQQPVPSATAVAVVPRLVSFSGRALDAEGKPLSGIAGVTFTIYKGQYDGASLWMETQNVQADSKGNYSIQLGATKSDGLPVELFASGEARWLGVRVNGGEEQPRVMLLSVPYALKAGDAATIGGLPPSAFVLAGPPSRETSSGAAGTSGDAATANPAPGATPAASNVTTSDGTVNALPLWTTATNVQSSAITQTGSGATAKIGIGTTTPATALDVHGGSIVRGTFVLPATAAATASAGKTSQPENFVASSFSSATSTPVNQTFQWQATPANNNTSNPGATLNLLYGLGATAPAQTGLRIGPKGIIGFAPAQTFPGTVKSVGFSAPSSDFTVSGSPVTGSGTLGLSWNIAPTTLDESNAIVKRDATGSFSAGRITATNNTAGSAAIFALDNGSSYGVHAVSAGIGVYGDGLNEGVAGFSSGGSGVYGQGLFGVLGLGDRYGLYGVSQGTNADADGVHGETDSATASGVAGVNEAGGAGVYGVGGNGVIGSSGIAGGVGVGAYNSSTGDALFAENQSGGFAAFFLGDVDVDGNLSKAGGSFKIDHPLDPANKYLYHSFVESPDMMNIYNGNVTLDGNGEAVVPLPDWFQDLNRDFRYQLTCLDGFAPIYVAQRVQGNHFKIAGGKPGMEVSWQVTGVRQDAWANAHRIPVEQMKPEKERGSYLHPELFGAPSEKSIGRARHPEPMTRAKERPQALVLPRH
jgi:trimeric autotransporter adhesin